MIVLSYGSFRGCGSAPLGAHASAITNHPSHRVWINSVNHVHLFSFHSRNIPPQSRDTVDLSTLTGLDPIPLMLAFCPRVQMASSAAE